MSTVQEAAGQQVARRAEAKQTVSSMLNRLRPEIQRALPKGMDADRIARLALTLVRKTPDLANCTPESFAGALLTASAMGLEPGLNNEAHLVPYKGECTLIIGYGGYVKLFWNSPLAKHIDAHAVHLNDVFEYAYGTRPYLTHQPAGRDRGPVTHYYAVATLTTGAEVFTVLTADECKALRGGKVGPDSRFRGDDPMRWMERKTALKQLAKMLPKSAELNRAIEVDEHPGAELQAELVAATGPPQITATEHGHVDTTTGEVIEGEVVDGALPDPYDGNDPWRTP